MDHNARMVSRWLAFVVWGVVGFSAAAWLLQMTAMARPVPTHAVAVDTTASPRADWTRLFGAPAVEAVSSAPKADARFKLIGVVAAPSPAAVGQSVALLQVDNNPPKPVKVGATVDGDTLLLAVRARAVDLGPRGGPPTVTLELAPLAPPATGRLGGTGPAGEPSTTPPPSPPGAMPMPAVNMPQPPAEAQPIAPQLPALPPQAPPNMPAAGSPQS